MLLVMAAFFGLILDVDLLLLKQVVLEILKIRHLRPGLRHHLWGHLVRVAWHEDLVLELHWLLVALEVVLKLHHVRHLHLPLPRQLSDLHLRHHTRQLLRHDLVRHIRILTELDLLLRRGLRLIGGLCLRRLLRVLLALISH